MSFNSRIRFSIGQASEKTSGRRRSSIWISKPAVRRDQDSLENIEDFFQSSGDEEEITLYSLRREAERPEPEDDCFLSRQHQALNENIEEEEEEEEEEENLDEEEISFDLFRNRPHSQQDHTAARNSSPQQDFAPPSPPPKQKNIKKKKTFTGFLRRQMNRQRPLTEFSSPSSSSPSPSPSPRPVRNRMTPIKYWEGEQVMYSRRGSVIGKKIIQTPQNITLRTPRRQRDQQEIPISPYIAATPLKTPNRKTVSMIFDENKFSSGQLILKGTKKRERTAKSIEIFHILSGSVFLQVDHETEVQLHAGTQFWVEQGTLFSLRNPNMRKEPRLLFTRIKE